MRIFKQIFNKNTILTCDYMSILKGFIPSYEEKQALKVAMIENVNNYQTIYDLRNNY